MQPKYDDMKKKVVFLLAAVLMMASCREKGALDAAEQTSFETMTVSKQDITLEQSYPAQIDGRQSVKIIPRVEGYLRQICVKEGQRVKKGQVLFVIDQATYKTILFLFIYLRPILYVDLLFYFEKTNNMQIYFFYSIFTIFSAIIIII